LPIHAITLYLLVLCNIRQSRLVSLLVLYILAGNHFTIPLRAIPTLSLYLQIRCDALTACPLFHFLNFLYNNILLLCHSTSSWCCP